MAVRYIGRARLLVVYSDQRGDYRVQISAGRGAHETVYVRPPRAPRGYGVDHPAAYDEAAHAAASFASKDTIKDALEDGGLGESGWVVQRTRPRLTRDATGTFRRNPQNYLFGSPGVPQDFHGKPLEHLSQGFYRVTDAMAGRLAKLVGKQLPARGKELRVVVPGRVDPMWLTRTKERGYTARPWVWAVY